MKSGDKFAKDKRQSTAILDWHGKLMRREVPLPDRSQIPDWSLKASRRAMKVMGNLRFPSLPGTPKFKKVAPRYIWEFARCWFGCEDPKTGDRLINECLLTVAKKNTKTTSMAFILLTHWMLSRKPDALAVIVSPTVQASEIAFDIIRGIIEATPGLLDVYEIIPSSSEIRSIEKPRKRLRIVAASPNVLVGTTASFVLVDELHQFATKTKARMMLTHIRGARKQRGDALTLIASTHAHEAGNDIWEETLARHRDVRDGKMYRPDWLMVGYEYTQEQLETKAFEDPSMWYITNPMLGEGIDEDLMLRDFETAQNNGPAAFAEHCCQNLNVPPGIWRADASWDGMQYWDQCFEPAISASGIAGAEALSDRCDIIVAGIDGGGMSDFLALVLLGIERGTGRWLAWAHAWIHIEHLKRNPELEVKAQYYANRDEITIVDKAAIEEGGGRRSIDLTAIWEILCALNERVKLPDIDSIGVDDVADVRYDTALVRPHADFHTPTPEQIGRVMQGGRLGSIIKGLPRRMADGEFGHCGSEAFAWHCGCAVIEQQAVNCRATKIGLSAHEKIDMFIALLNAVWVLRNHQHDVDLGDPVDEDEQWPAGKTPE